MADVELSYKGAIIGSMSASGSLTLETAGKYCEDDIEVEYTKPSGPTPTGTKAITISGPGTVTEDVTNYAAAEITVPAGSAATPATTVPVTPAISVSASGLITAAVSASQNITPSVSPGYVSAGTPGAVSVSGSNTSQLPTQAAQTITPTTTDQTIASGKYLTGTQTIKGDANLVAENIKKDVSIFGVTGTYEGGGGGGTSDYEVHPVTITSTSNVFIKAPFLSTYPPDTLGAEHYINRNTPTTVNFVFYKGRCYTGIDDMWVLSGAAAYDDEYYEWYFTGEGSVSMELD